MILMFATLLLFCSQIEKNNPLLSSYPGDYRFELLTPSSADTLAVFEPYRLHFRITGSDTFDRFEISGAAAAAFDAAIFADSLDISYSTVCLYPVKPFSGMVQVDGVRPNDKRVSHSVALTIMNPYSITGDTLGGLSQNVALTVCRTDNRPCAPTIASVTWFIDNSTDTSLSIITPFPISSATQAKKRISALLTDIHGDTLRLLPHDVTFKGNAPVLETAILQDSATLGSTLSFAVTVNDNDRDPLGFIILAGSDTLIPSLILHPYTQEYLIASEKPLRDTGWITCRIYCRDSSGLRSNTIDTLVYSRYHFSIVKFPDSTRIVPLNESYTLSVEGSWAQHYRWKSRRLGFDTIIDSSSMQLTYVDSLTDTIQVWGMGDTLHTSGSMLAGPPATLVVTIRTFSNSLKRVAFPSEVRARHWGTWRVQAENTAGALPSGSAAYYWSISPDHLYDSIRVNAHELSLFFRDTAPSFTVSVIAVIGTDSTQEQTQSVTVRVYRPSIAFDSSSYTCKVNESKRFSVRATDPIDHAIAGIYYRIKYPYGDSAVHALNLDTSWTIAFVTPGSQTLIAWAFDADGFSSDTATARVEVTTTKPHFFRLVLDTLIYIHDIVAIRTPADPGNAKDSIVKYYWDLNSDGIWDDSTAVAQRNISYAAPGKDTLRVSCRNSIGEMPDSALRMYVIIDQGRPRVDSVQPRPTQQYINNQVTVRVRASDVNGRIKKLLIDTTQIGHIDTALTGLDAQTLDTQIVLTFAHAGTYSVKAAVVDDDTVTSAFAVGDSLVVIDPGNPRVLGIRPDTVWIYDDTGFTIGATDNKGVAEYAWSKDSINWSSWSADSVFHTAFTSAGVNYLWLKVRDGEGNTSAVVKEPVFVRLGKPMIGAITVDTAMNAIFVNDSRKFTIHYADSNGTVDSIRIDNGSGTFGAWQKAPRDSTVLSRKFAITEPGQRAIRVLVKDNNGIVSDTGRLTIAVRLGAPVIDSIAPDTVWVRDVNTFTVFAHDTNGLPDSFEIDWNNDGAYDDRRGSGTFTHAFDTSTTGMRSVVAHVMDNDSVWSTRALNVMVRLGRPMVKQGISSDSIQWDKGTAYDTMFYVYTGSGNTWVIIDTSDTNGFMQRFEWDRGNDGSWDYTTTQPALYQYFNLNAASLISVRGQDDDSVSSGKQVFYVFPDEPPPVPTLSNVTFPAASQVRLRWSGQDAKDGTNTQFEILCDQNNPPTTVISNFAAFPLDGTAKFYLDYAVLSTGTYYWKIIAKDARGSQAASSVNSFDF
jgi:hypothetical protein